MNEKFTFDGWMVDLDGAARSPTGEQIALTAAGFDLLVGVHGGRTGC